MSGGRVGCSQASHARPVPTPAQSLRHRSGGSIPSRTLRRTTSARAVAFTVAMRLARPLLAERVDVAQHRLEPPPGLAQGIQAALDLVALAGRLVGELLDVLRRSHRPSRVSTSVPHAPPGSAGDHRWLRRRPTTHHKTLGCENRFPSDFGGPDAVEKYLRCPDRKDATEGRAS